MTKTIGDLVVLESGVYVAFGYAGGGEFNRNACDAVFVTRNSVTERMRVGDAFDVVKGVAIWKQLDWPASKLTVIRDFAFGRSRRPGWFRRFIDCPKSQSSLRAELSSVGGGVLKFVIRSWNYSRFGHKDRILEGTYSMEGQCIKVYSTSGSDLEISGIVGKLHNAAVVWARNNPTLYDQ